MHNGYLQKTFDGFVAASYTQPIGDTQRTCLREAFFSGAIIALGVENPVHLIEEIEDYNRELQKRAARQN